VKLSRERIDAEDMRSRIQQEISNMAKYDTHISNLTERRGRIDYTKLIKDPTASIYPVSPKKKLNLLLAFILGLMFFTVVVVFMDYLERSQT
jgi:capsular polysaccharide biosynthesis protein